MANRNQVLFVRVTGKEKRVIDKRAENAGMSTSAWVRLMVRRAAGMETE